MGCRFCGDRVLSTGGCRNPNCASRRPTPPAFEAAETLAPPPPPSVADRIRELEAALQRYGRHDPGCNVSREPTLRLPTQGRVHLRVCTCGLADVLNRVT